MASKYANDTLWVRASRGELRQLSAFCERRTCGAKAGATDAEWRRWARDEAGRWYAFSDFGDAVIESLSGDWFAIVRKAHGKA